MIGGGEKSTRLGLDTLNRSFCFRLATSEESASGCESKYQRPFLLVLTCCLLLFTLDLVCMLNFNNAGHRSTPIVAFQAGSHGLMHPLPLTPFIQSSWRPIVSVRLLSLVCYKRCTWTTSLGNHRGRLPIPTIQSHWRRLPRKSVSRSQVRTLL